MNPVDAVAVRLGDPATRGGVLDEDALAAVVAAGYDADRLAPEGPYGAVFDELRLGVAPPSTATANAVWGPTGSAERTEGSLTFAAPHAEGPRIDALWRGAVVARVVHDRATIEAADITRPVAGELHSAAVSVAFSEAPPAAPQVLVLPVTAALLIRDADTSIAQLLADSRAVAEALEPLALERANAAGLPRRRPIVVVWLLPASTFDDPGWPGAAPAARRASAAAWLAEQGIALAAYTP